MRRRAVIDAEGRRPVLVTGIARAGTSWVGKMLEAGGHLVYLNEPMNPAHPPGRSPGVLNADIPLAYFYLTEQNEGPFLEAFRAMLALRYDVVAELGRNRAPYDLLRLGKYAGAFAWGRMRHLDPLVNDPFAVFSAGWFRRRLGCQVVVVVRSPEAVVASYKLYGIPTHVEDVAAQPLLVQDLLAPLREKLSQIPAQRDVVGRASLLWLAVHHGLIELQERFPKELWVVRHEDLALEPVEGFERLFGAVGLPFEDRGRRRVEWGTRSEAGEGNHSHTWTLRGGSVEDGVPPDG
jgi:hypothetical protein